jgi:hypothetical protein
VREKSNFFLQQKLNVTGVDCLKSKKGTIMATKEMTTREAYVAVVEGNITEEVKAKFETLIANLDAANAKRREKAAEKAAEKAQEDAGLIAQIVELLKNSEDGMTQTDIAEGLGGVISAQKAGRLAKQIEGAEQFEKKIEKRKVKAYRMA